MAVDLDQLNPEHVIENYRKSGRPYILYAGLLDLAHTEGIESVNTDLMQAPHPANDQVAIVKATVVMENGTSFSGIGDASPENVGNTIKPHLIRMAETRAKARAFRDALNPLGAGVDETDFVDESEAGEAGEADDFSSTPGPVAEGNRARQFQVDMLKALAVELRGENGVELFEKRLGKKVDELTRAEADYWIERLTPDAQR